MSRPYGAGFGVFYPFTYPSQWGWGVGAGPNPGRNKD